MALGLQGQPRVDADSKHFHVAESILEGAGLSTVSQADSSNLTLKSKNESATDCKHTNDVARTQRLSTNTFKHPCKLTGFLMNSLALSLSPSVLSALSSLTQTHYHSDKSPDARSQKIPAGLRPVHIDKYSNLCTRPGVVGACKPHGRMRWDSAPDECGTNGHQTCCPTTQIQDSVSGRQAKQRGAGRELERIKCEGGRDL